jgi:hypothetical protein
MENQLQELLENAVLGDEARQALQEAFSNKIKEAEAKLQESYASRYEHEKHILVETMDQLLNDVITKELTEFHADKRSVASQKVKLAKTLAEAKQAAQADTAKKLKVMESFMMKQIAAELAEFRADRKALNEQKQILAQQLNEHQVQTEQDFNSRVQKLEEFVLRQLSEEIREFAADKKALVEQRVKLASEANKKLTETRTQFVKRATQVVDRTLNEVIRKELVQWKDDIKVARENNFGRKIFEAVAAEYMSSYLAEGTATKKLQNELQHMKAQLQEAQAQVQKNQTLLESEKKATQIARDRAQRVEVLTGLLSPLRSDKRAVMENLLQDVKTTQLKEAFHRYMPAVMNNNSNVTQPKKPTTSVQPRTVAHSGDRVNLVETSQPKTEDDQDLQNILYLAGLSARSQ